MNSTASITMDRQASASSGQTTLRKPTYFGVTFIAIVALVIETMLFYWALHGSFGLPFLLLVHLIVLAGILIASRIGMREARPRHLYMLLMCFTAVLGVFGAAGILLTIILQHNFKKRSVDDWFSQIFPDDPTSDGELLVDELLRFGHLADQQPPVIPFNETLALGTANQKMHMIGLMGRNFHPSFARSLKLALQDRDNAVRVQAATAIAAIEDRYSMQLQVLEAKHHKDPQDMNTVRALATLHDNYAFSGILDDVREAEHRDVALALYKQCLSYNPEDEQLCLAIGRIYHRNGNTHALVEWMHECLEKGMEHPSILTWLLEGYFIKRDYASVSAMAKRYHGELSDQTMLPLEIREAVEAWSGQTTLAHDLNEEEASHG